MEMEKCLFNKSLFGIHCRASATNSLKNVFSHSPQGEKSNGKCFLELSGKLNL